jgi:hypothetical protein
VSKKYQQEGKNMTTKEAIDHFGSVKALADALRIWPHSVYKWGERPPMLRQYQIQVLTRGEIRADD